MKIFNYKSLLFMVVMFISFLGCESDSFFEDQVPDYTYSIMRSLTINDNDVSIDHTTGTVNYTLPAGSSLTGVSVSIGLPEGATVSPESGASVDFSNGPVIFTVTNNGVSREYTVTVNAFGTPEITSFAIGSQQATINQDTGAITLKISSLDNIRSVAPLFTIPSGATVTPASGIAQDFSNPVEYRVLSNDGFTGKTYTVIADQWAKAEIETFVSGDDACSVSAIINNDDFTVNINLPAGSSVSALAPTISLPEGTTSQPASGETQDFSQGAVNYAVTNLEGITNNYAVSVNFTTSSNRVAFISGANCVETIGEADTKAAATWLRNNYPNDFVYLQASNLTAQDLANTDVVLLYWDTSAVTEGDTVGTADMPDGGLSSDKIQIIKDYYKAGGNLMVEGFAINLLDELERINVNGTILENNGGRLDLNAVPNGDAWGMRREYPGSPDASANHPVIQNLQSVGDAFPMNNAGFKEDRNFGIDFGPIAAFTEAHCTEERALEFEQLTNSVLIRWYEWLPPRGCGIGVAEFKPQGDFQGTLIVNTGGWLEFSMEDNNGAVNDYESNIHLFHSNAIDYLLNL